MIIICLRVTRTNFEICEPCALDWQNRVKFVIVVHHTKGMLHYVHTDV